MAVNITHVLLEAIAGRSHWGKAAFLETLQAARGVVPAGSWDWDNGPPEQWGYVRDGGGVYIVQLSLAVPLALLSPGATSVATELLKARGVVEFTVPDWEAPDFSADKA